MPDCPLDLTQVPSFEALQYEPFYGWLRQQLLAREMEKAREQGAGCVSLLQIAPAHNVELGKVTSPALRPLGDSATAVWQRMVTGDRFQSISTEVLFAPLLANPSEPWKAWATEIAQRYPWVLETGL